jgi:hypothetical protein
VLGLPVVKLAVRLAGLLALSGLLASCTAAPDPVETTAAPAVTTPAQVPAQPTPAATGAAPTPKLLNFTAPRLGGGQVVGSELVGKDVAMFFWAPW